MILASERRSLMSHTPRARSFPGSSFLQQPQRLHWAERFTPGPIAAAPTREKQDWARTTRSGGRDSDLRLIVFAVK